MYVLVVVAMAKKQGKVYVVVGLANICMYVGEGGRDCMCASRHTAHMYVCGGGDERQAVKEPEGGCVQHMLRCISRRRIS